MKLKKAIRIKDYNKRQEHRFRDDLLEAIGPQIFDLYNEQDFVYQALLLIDITPQKLENSEGAINRILSKLLSYFGHDPIKDSIITFFRQEVLLVKYLPALTYRKIESLVREDLLKINKLIEGYEARDYIKKLNSEDEKPRNHEEKILHDFYKRCVSEQKIIWNYYLTGIKDRAMAGMQWIPGMLGLAADWGREYRDRPYHFWIPYRDHFYDASRIDDFWHRLKLFPVKFEDEAEVMYKKNKKKFYRKFFKEHKSSTVFHYIGIYLSYLPLNEARASIFSELKYLYEHRRWIGFYSLALAQVEGLFSEMNRMISGSEGNGKQALPDKVQLVRKYYHMSDYYFDYYQYQVPRLRNKFMHTGYDVDYQIKSYDLLLDLAYLLNAVNELNIPYVKINAILTARKFDDFINYKDYAKYFTLINDLQPSQKKELELKLIGFEASTLKDYFHVDYIANEVIRDFPLLMDDFILKLFEVTKSEPVQFDLKTVKKPQIIKLFKDDYYFEKIKRFFQKESKAQEDIIYYEIYLRSYHKMLPSLERETKEELSQLNKKYNSVLIAFNDCRSQLAT